MNRQFSISQNRAINHYTGPCLVLAGPGSGKTTVITHRTKNLIEKFGVNPSNILVITFTKAAALEMQERFETLMEGQKPPVSFGTFHAVFFRVLKYAYNYSAQNIIREEEKYRLIKSLIDNEQLEIEDEKEFISSVIAEIGNIKGDMIDINHYYSTSCSDEIFRRIYNRYEEKLRCTNQVDFDDMLVMCYELFVARPDILRAWQNKYEYILIDEFQDINRIQYEIIKMLAKPQDNLFIVGDDDQSVYRFRGARPEIMLNFEKDYEGTERIVLEENYRSTDNIVCASLRLINNNKQRFSKTIRAVREKGCRVEYAGFQSPAEENKRIVEDIIKNIKNGRNYSEMAILFRTNMGPRLLIDKFMEYNIPFHMKDAMPNIYEHFIAKDIMAYIKIALGENTRENYLRIINRPKRYVARDILTCEEVLISELRVKCVGKKWLSDKLDKLDYDLTMMKNMSPYAAICYIRQGIGYDKFLEEYADFRRMNVEELFEVANELTEMAKEYTTYASWFEYMQEYSEELLRQAKQNRKIENAVELCTMHGAKGLEYEIVYVADAVEGVTPHNKAVLEDDIEEERRLFYVAVTRAKNELHIFWTKERFNKPVELSRFVKEMMVDCENLTEGLEVTHRKYGKGVIRKIDEGKAVIYFWKTRKELVFDIKYTFGNRILEIVEKD